MNHIKRFNLLLQMDKTLHVATATANSNSAATFYPVIKTSSADLTDLLISSGVSTVRAVCKKSNHMNVTRSVVSHRYDAVCLQKKAA